MGKTVILVRSVEMYDCYEGKQDKGNTPSQLNRDAINELIGRFEKNHVNLWKADKLNWNRTRNFITEAYVITVTQPSSLCLIKHDV